MLIGDESTSKKEVAFKAKSNDDDDKEDNEVFALFVKKLTSS